jgi:3-phenylpropionate/trans-cinnamate dioxygenase ferredoxin reductase subunit
MSRTVIVGAGVAGVQTALELRHRHWTGEIVLVGEETELPYDRPPLSKEFLKGDAGRDSLHLLPAQTARDRDITTVLGQRVTDIDTTATEVELTDGTRLHYDHLVLATGAHNRALPVPGADLPGVWSLRRVDEAEGLRSALRDAAKVVIVGGGFIGLEVAAAAHARGAQVTVVEFLPRVMARVLSPEMSHHFTDEHRSRGVDIRTNVGVTAILEGPDGSAAGVTLSDGNSLQADVVVIGVGVIPTTELAENAGIRTGDGVMVDGHLRTSDQRVFAIGDCAQFDCAITGRLLRLESIQNAADQARFVAGEIASSPTGNTDDESDGGTYNALPWFWTEQYSSKLQIAGVATSDADSVVRGDPASDSFSVCRFLHGRLVGVESVNHAKDHLGARKLLSAAPSQLTRVTPDAVADAATPLKALLDPPSVAVSA